MFVYRYIAQGSHAVFLRINVYMFMYRIKIL
jgi:hypothetical protein